MRSAGSGRGAHPSAGLEGRHRCLPRGEADVAGGRHGRGRRQHRGHGPAAARRDGPPVLRSAGPLHAGVVPALLHARACEATARRGPPVPARTGPSHPTAARRGPGRLRGHRRHHPPHLRLRQTRHRVRIQQGQGPERTARYRLHTPVRPRDRRHQAAQGPSNSARGAAAFVAETIRTARACGASGLLVMRADSAFYGADVINACRTLGARFSVTVRMNASVKAAIARIDEDAWTPIKYPKAVWDEEGQCWISDAEIAEVPYTAFTSKPKKQQVTARLIVRRVKRLNAGGVPAGQGTLFDTWRYHAAFTDSPLSLADAERDHRRHAVVEQVIADVKNSAFAHAPSGHFQANAAWLALAALAHNLTRAAGALASTFHAKATTATIRDHLINVPARLARSARRLTLHLPERWPWREDFAQLFSIVHAPPVL
ncbi:IS1380 family transposase [Streptomyces mirabilis]|nr:IS1380 family transposase [Streptomyces mirabilis]MCX4418648.1 IS1380 family transposase [Streptomyces mirabilis]MCX4426216.1 IS1380 family transposase [Streptomyces mirabilis]MCX4427010.1 IS1380 family transposase [Streptomyces mirabilis]MCX4429035.1 IS1380 family transposase [Streptomyces mirabilis]